MQVKSKSRRRIEKRRAASRNRINVRRYGAFRAFLIRIGVATGEC